MPTPMVTRNCAVGAGIHCMACIPSRGPSRCGVEKKSADSSDSSRYEFAQRDDPFRDRCLRRMAAALDWCVNADGLGSTFRCVQSVL